MTTTTAGEDSELSEPEPETPSAPGRVEEQVPSLGDLSRLDELESREQVIRGSGQRPWMLTVIIAIAGLWQFVPGLLVTHLGLIRVARFSSGSVHDIHILATAFGSLSGLVLVVLARQIYRQKRRAWWVATILTGIGIVLAVFGGQLILFVIMVLAFVGLLIRRDEFRAEADPPTIVRLLIWIPIYVVFLLAVGGVMLLANRHHLRPRLTLSGWIDSVFGRVVGVGSDYRFDDPTFERTYAVLMIALGIIGILLLAFFFFRPIIQRADHTTEEWEHAQRLVRQYGWDTLAYFVLRPDKSFFFSSDGEAMLAYGYRGGYALVSGDPVGRPESIPLLLEEFFTMCRKNAWKFAFLAVREADVPLYERFGLHALYMGDEAIIHPDTFDLDGHDMRKVRQTARRFEKAGYTYEFMTEAECDRNLMLRLNQISADWRGDKPEEGFTTALSQDMTGAYPDCGIAVAFDAENVPMGFMHLIPCFGDEPGYSLDIMRYERDAPNGIMEYLIASTAISLGRRGITRLSSNFAAFGRLLDDDLDFQGLQRVARWGVKKLSKVYQADNLRTFNTRFQPHWLPRVIVYRDARDMASIGLLYLGAERILRLPGLGLILEPRARNKTPPMTGSIKHAPLGAGTRPRSRMISEPISPDDLGQTPLFQARVSEANKMREDGIEPWPILTDFAPDTTVRELRDRYGEIEPDTETGATVSIGGRVLALRKYGALTFGDIRDRTGEIQIYVRRDRTKAEEFSAFAKVKVGDFIGVTGEVMTTKTGELSIRPTRILLTSKALRALPDRSDGFTDPELRARHRYLDLIMNDDARERAIGRSKAIATIREFMAEHEFIEVETAILQNIPGGAAAKPFITHHNALHIDIYLRIALELQLKRLIVGGLERVFELSRTFRNEGIDNRHNPEFTMMEAYCTYMDYWSMMTFTEEMVARVATAVTGGTVVTIGGREMDLTPPWERITMVDAITRETGLDLHLDQPIEVIRERVESYGVETEPNWGGGRILDEIYDEHVQSKIWGPVFLHDYPAETSPLAKQHRDNPLYAERFEVITAGREMVNSYTEQNDPIVQREALMAQMGNREAGDDEAERIDFDFLRAMEHAMPPLGGMGIGIDRLVMLLTDTDHIKDVILFPTYRPVAGG